MKLILTSIQGSQIVRFIISATSTCFESVWVSYLRQRPMRRWFSIYYSINVSYHTYEGTKLVRSSLIRLLLCMSHLCLYWPFLLSQSNPLCHLHFLLLVRTRFLPLAQIERTFSSGGVLLISYCTYAHKSLFLSSRAGKAAENKRSCSPVLFPGGAVRSSLLPHLIPASHSISAVIQTYGIANASYQSGR